MPQTTLLITDTNIWFDLDHAGLINQIFMLPYSISTADFARAELLTVNTEELEKRGLIFLTLEAKFVLELQQLRGETSAIAVADMAGFILARENKATLVSGDKRLTTFSRERNVLVHGLLWLMDEMVANKILTGIEAAEKLKIILKMGSRLPKDECQKRFEKWK